LKAPLPGPLRRALRRGRELVGDHPAFLPLVLALTPEGFARAIGPRTQLVVEGYPRSGNTYAATAIAMAQPGGLVVATHVHVPAQVKRAVARGLPTLFVVRHPIDAVASTIVAAPHIRPAAALREYDHHHQEVLPLADRLVVATFEQVTTDLGGVVARLNQRFAIALVPFDHTDASEAAVQGEIERHYDVVHGRTGERAVPRPSEARRDETARVRAVLTAPALAELLSRAERTYQSMVALSTR
jgi:hypothetical protein